jgi:hypothetical protein
LFLGKAKLPRREVGAGNSAEGCTSFEALLLHYDVHRVERSNLTLTRSPGLTRRRLFEKAIQYCLPAMAVLLGRNFPIVPYIVNLLMDPMEKMTPDSDEFGYIGREFFAHKLWVPTAAGPFLAAHMKSLEEFPPSQGADTLSMKKATDWDGSFGGNSVSGESATVDSVVG